MTDRLAFSSTVESDGRRLKGSVQLAGQRTFRNGEWVEVDPAALIKADASNVMGLFEHDPGKVLSRASNKTLSIVRTEQGFDWEMSALPNVSYANDALELIHGGYVGGTSFTIDGLKSSFSTDPDGTRVRRYTQIKRLVDVSPVFDPAFISTVTAFSNKESDHMDDPKDPQEPKPDEPKEPEAKAKFTEQPKSANGWASVAKNATNEQLEGGMEAIFAQAKGDLSGDALDQYEAFSAELQGRRQADAQTKARIAQMEARHAFAMGRIPKAPESGEVFASDDYEQAFKKYLVDGNPRHMEQFAQTIAGDGSQGGFTVPDGFVAKLTQRLKDYGGIASVASEITTSSGESLRWPYIDDTANKAQIVAEDTQATTGADLVFDSIELGAFEYDATGASGNPIEISLPLLQDAAFDLESMLVDILGKRIGRKQADHFATGAGGTEPVGLLSKSADTMTATVASLAAPEMVFQVDRAYRDNARWVMSDTTLAKLWSAQATTNEPLFMPGRTLNGKPFDVLFGYPITIDNSAGNLVAFGDIAAGYIIRRVRGVQLLVDPYVPMVRRAVRYHAWARADANIQDPNAYSVSTWASVSADT